MNNQQILDNAPDGATHFDKIEGEIRYFTSNGYGFLCSEYFAPVLPEDIIRVRSLADIKRIAELEKGIKIALFGTPIDDYGNLDIDGLYGYPDTEKTSAKLSALVPDSTRITFGKELEKDND
jgi:hypothetical protein